MASNVGFKAPGATNESGEIEVDVNLGQTRDAGNTQTVSSSEASPGSPWVGDWVEVLDANYVRLLTVVAATSVDVAGTFTFELTQSSDPNTDHPTLGTAEVSKAQEIPYFPSPDGTEVGAIPFDLNVAGASYYRVAYEPDSALGSELVFVTTVLRRQDDGAFATPANEQANESWAAFGGGFAYNRAFDPFTGDSVNSRPTVNDPGNSADDSDALGSSEVFRGAWREWSTLGYVALQTSVSADVGGTFYIDLSNEESPVDGDESSVEDSFELTYAPANNPVLRRVTPIQSRWVRVRYVNGGAGQTSFAIESVFLVAPPPLVMQHINVQPTEEMMAGLVAALLSAPDAAGIYDSIERFNKALKVSISEQEIDVEIASLPNWETGQQGVSTTPSQIATPALANRRSITIKSDPSNNAFVWIAETSAKATSAPFILAAGDSVDLELDETAEIYARSSSGTETVVWIEAGE